MPAFIVSPGGKPCPLSSAPSSNDELLALLDATAYALVPGFDAYLGVAADMIVDDDGGSTGKGHNEEATALRDRGLNAADLPSSEHGILGIAIILTGRDRLP